MTEHTRRQHKSKRNNSLEEDDLLEGEPLEYSKLYARFTGLKTSSETLRLSALCALSLPTPTEENLKWISMRSSHVSKKASTTGK